jgi:uroporphyrinogen III methyltransferase/synthase
MPIPLKIGSRDSRLAVLQTEQALARLRDRLPEIAFEPVALSSPGDRDRRLDLRESPPDFFTRDLDQALLEGRLDAALHSAKDMPDPVPEGLDWVWLPWQEDPRDVLVLGAGKTLADLPPSPRIGVSSERRAAWSQARFPGCRPLSIRGNIEDRLAQLDASRYDGLVMAAAALIRLGLDTRIAEWIPCSDSSVPDGQGSLALAFRSDDPRFLLLRRLFVKPVTFAGAGCGSAGSCTLAGVEALRQADVCLYDALLDPALLDFLPAGATRIDVGKRAGAHRSPQDEINRLLTLHARRGRRVVRLKGGDPGIYGRLSEELEALEALRLPYRILPGVSSLTAATTGTGMLLTQRGVSPGFSVLTPRRQGGGAASIRQADRPPLPLVLFMGVGVLTDLVAQLLSDGLPAATPAAVAFDAGSTEELIVRGTLADLPDKIPATDRPGLILVGELAARRTHPEWGALGGRRVLLTCSGALQEKAARAVRDYGGIPLSRPLMKMALDPECLPVLKTLSNYDWLVVTSPSAVTMLMQALARARIDRRRLPRILAAGPGTAAAFHAEGIFPEAVPEHNFGTAGVLQAAPLALGPEARLLRLRSAAAGPELAKQLAGEKRTVTDCVLYTHQPIRPDQVPAFDAVFFASASAVETFMSLQEAGSLAAKQIAILGKPTLAALARHGLPDAFMAQEATVEGALAALAAGIIRKEWEKL